MGKGPLAAIAQDNKLVIYNRNDFWICMEALLSLIELVEVWNTGKAQLKT